MDDSGVPHASHRNADGIEDKTQTIGKRPRVDEDHSEQFCSSGPAPPVDQI